MATRKFLDKLSKKIRDKEIDFQFIVFNDGDFGVKIGNDLFSYYKDESPMQRTGEGDGERPVPDTWRPIEDGEFDHVILPYVVRQNPGALTWKFADGDPHDRYYNHGQGWRRVSTGEKIDMIPNAAEVRDAEDDILAASAETRL